MMFIVSTEFDQDAQAEEDRLCTTRTTVSENCAYFAATVKVFGLYSNTRSLDFSSQSQFVKTVIKIFLSISGSPSAYALSD